MIRAGNSNSDKPPSPSPSQEAGRQLSSSFKIAASQLPHVFRLRLPVPRADTDTAGVRCTMCVEVLITLGYIEYIEGVIQI